MAIFVTFILTLAGVYPLAVAVAKKSPAGILSRVAVSAISGVAGQAIAGIFGFSLGIVGGAVLPSVLRDLRERRRLKKARSQFPDALTLIASGLRAGLSGSQALGIAAREIDAPLRDELRRIDKLTQVGIGFAQGLESVAGACHLRDAALALSSISFQMGLGGNLAELLDRIALDLREREAFAGKMAAGTAQGRLTGVIVALLPMGLGVLMNALSPDYLSPLFRLPAGRVMLVIAVTLNLAGLALINKLSAVEIG